jgi:hypothetical protein
MPLKMVDGSVSFRVLVDRPMYELIGGDGACYKTSGRRDMGQPLNELTITAEGGAMQIDQLRVYRMKPIWKQANGS